MVWLSYRLQKPSNTLQHMSLPKQFMVSGTHVVYSFSFNSYARPVCFSSHDFILPRIMHDSAKPYVQACLCYAGLDTLFSSCRDKSGAFCKLLCLGSSPGCWREMVHSYISLNTQGKDCTVTCSVHTFQAQTHDSEIQMRLAGRTRDSKGLPSDLPSATTGQSRLHRAILPQ